jgi:hypothetical protein
MAEETGRRGVLGSESTAGFDTAMVQLLSYSAVGQHRITNWFLCRWGKTQEY